MIEVSIAWEEIGRGDGGRAASVEGSVVVRIWVLNSTFGEKRKKTVNSRGEILKIFEGILEQ